MQPQSTQIKPILTACRKAISKEWTVTFAASYLGCSRTVMHKKIPLFKKYGTQGLYDRKQRRPPRISREIEAMILVLAFNHPSWGCQRISYELRLQEIFVSHGAVQDCFHRHGIPTIRKRHAWAQKEHGLGQYELEPTDKGLSKKRHVRADYPGYLVGTDTKTICRIEGVGKVVSTVFVDIASSFAWCRLSPAKDTGWTTQALEDVLATPKAKQIGIKRVLSDNGKEFQGLFRDALLTYSIKPKYTKEKHPWTNGSAESFNRTIMDDFFSNSS